MVDVKHVCAWLVAGAPGSSGASSGAAAVVGRLGEDLLAAGVPLDRIAAYVRTLHPNVMGRSFVWAPGEEVQVREAPHDIVRTDEYRKSPVMVVAETRRPLRRRLSDPAQRDFAVLESLAARGFTDYLAGPLEFLGGEVHCVAFATRGARGFDDSHVEALVSVLAPLARVGEILALRRTAVNLLDTYVGRHAGERVLAGKILRGDVDSIRAVLWCSDLRGFTSLAATIDGRALVGVLNDLFDCQVPAIEGRGGEVLKFMGDGLLAIFPIDTAGRGVAEQCDAALEAASEAYGALAKLNAARAEKAHAPIRFGLALHVGDVEYGNIGGKSRLDFTCIGPAVNLAARLEGLTGRIDRPVVASAEFARTTTRAMMSVGTFELKGVAQAQAVFAPSEGEGLTSW